MAHVVELLPGLERRTRIPYSLLEVDIEPVHQAAKPRDPKFDVVIWSASVTIHSPQ
jgi:hypothetical protein